LVAGILEEADVLEQRAADEALEEAGLRIDPQSVLRLGPPMFPSPGMCAEMFHFVCAEVRDAENAAPRGDGSPFEEGAQLEWVSLAKRSTGASAARSRISRPSWACGACATHSVRLKRC